MRKDDAIRFFGSSAKLARALGISRQAVSKWEDEVPESRRYQLHVLTGGALKAPEKTEARKAG